ncbi:MAG: HEPN domain-containing protein [Candidatus Desantisbacteria bacterium]
MTKEEFFDYWVKTSEYDFITMEHLFEREDYLWALFIGHLVIEKLLKGYYVKQVDLNVPYIHDLLRIAEKSSLELSIEQKTFLDGLNNFNIEARYPDHKLTLYKKCTQEFTLDYLEKIREFKKWILKEIKG